MCQGACVEVRGQLCKIDSLLLPLMWVLGMKHRFSGLHERIANTFTGQPSNPPREGFFIYQNGRGKHFGWKSQDADI